MKLQTFLIELVENADCRLVDPIWMESIFLPGCWQAMHCAYWRGVHRNNTNHSDHLVRLQWIDCSHNLFDPVHFSYYRVRESLPSPLKQLATWFQWQIEKRQKSLNWWWTQDCQKALMMNAKWNWQQKGGEGGEGGEVGQGVGRKWWKKHDHNLQGEIFGDIKLHNIDKGMETVGQTLRFDRTLNRSVGPSQLERRTLRLRVHMKNLGSDPEPMRVTLLVRGLLTLTACHNKQHIALA